MNETEPLHTDLLQALLPIIPRTTYQDIRRLNTLVWAIVGLCLTQTVRLSSWAQVLEGRAQYAASRVRRFSALCCIILLFLQHSGMNRCCKRLWWTGLWSSGSTSRLPTTALTPFVLIRASLVYRGRAIPLAWRAMRHRSTQVSFEAYQPVLDQVSALLPTGQVITLLADRGGCRISDCFTTSISTNGTFACGCLARPWSISEPSLFLLSGISAPLLDGSGFSMGRRF